MVRNILKHGYPVTAYDLVDSKIDEAVRAGAGRAHSCRAVAEQSDTVITILPAAEHVKAAILGPDGAIEGLAAGSTLIEMSTVAAATIYDIARLLMQRKIRVLAAPVVKGVKGAVDGTLGIYAGGDPAVFEACRPLLATMGTEIEYCGDLGSGNVVKLINNMVVGISVCVLSEAIVLGAKAGVGPEVLLSSLGSGSANSFVLQNHIKDHALTGHCPEGLFSIEYELKDLALALATAKDLGIPQHFAALAHQTYEEASALGLAKNYYPAVIAVAERLAGVSVRPRAG